MQTEVYADLYFLVNASMDLLCLLLTARLLQTKTARWRALLAAVFGGGFSLWVLLFGITGWLELLLDLAAALAICAIGFAGKGTGLGRLARTTAVFFLVSAILGGIMTALYELLNRMDLPFEAFRGETISVWMFAVLSLAAGILTAVLRLDPLAEREQFGRRAVPVPGHGGVHERSGPGLAVHGLRGVKRRKAPDVKSGAGERFMGPAERGGDVPDVSAERYDAEDFRHQQSNVNALIALTASAISFTSSAGTALSALTARMECEFSRLCGARTSPMLMLFLPSRPVILPMMPGASSYSTKR